ncbi:ABC transporter substrate-binding protein [Bordetella genomosp. 10]|uniref:ABC transporter substrate-binding protein n=1 Tax=Bordetella genomosp. 10 TaxID=1416804 RepID=A0A261SJP1_9BORD|nr:tripartite tricarboxylate transporter substrate binding protein [Bordetella genomosp. 10]OZI37385.1 ABC transporter substrate-binding protein [Bordetella genomosp. 10]
MLSPYMRRRLCAWLLPLASALSSVPATAHAAANDWPERPVTIVVGYAPGGMTDIVSRLLAKELTATFKQNFIVENKAGAAGQVATEYVARRPADGYTLLITATGYVISPFTQQHVNYDPAKDLLPLAALVQTPNMIVVNPGIPPRTPAEFLEWARKQTSVPYATSGAGGSTHLAGELLRKESGAPFVHVPYRGAAPAVTDTVAGQIQVSVMDSVTVTPFLAAGKLRPIALTSAHRSELFPEIPTLAESGFKDFDVYTWLGLFAPANLPPDIAAKINAATTRIVQAPEMVETLRKQSSEPTPPRDLAQTRQFVLDELDKWRTLVQTTGIRIKD